MKLATSCSNFVRLEIKDKSVSDFGSLLDDYILKSFANGGLCAFLRFTRRVIRTHESLINDDEGSCTNSCIGEIFWKRSL